MDQDNNLIKITVHIVTYKTDFLELEKSIQSLILKY